MAKYVIKRETRNEHGETIESRSMLEYDNFAEAKHYLEIIAEVLNTQVQKGIGALCVEIEWDLYVMDWMSTPVYADCKYYITKEN